MSTLQWIAIAVGVAVVGYGVAILGGRTPEATALARLSGVEGHP